MGAARQIKVFDLRTGKQRSVKADGATLEAVTGDGRVIVTRRTAEAPRKMGAGQTLLLIGPDGKSLELAKPVQAATLAGGRIYYVAAIGKGIVLKVLPLPKAASTAPSK